MFTQNPSETTDTQTNALTPSSISEKHELADGSTLHIKTFDQLTTSELYNLLHVRSSVFIVEQNCVYQDIDYNDQTAIHLWITQDGKTVAICRICPAGTKLGDVSIGRVISTERGKGYGKVIFQAAIDAAKRFLKDFDTIKIESQLTKQHFYEKFGFQATSGPFMMEGLLHLNMILKIE